MVLRIARNEHLRLCNAKGASLRVVEGRVWITETGCGRDSFLAAGSGYCVRGDGVVLVSPAPFCEEAVIER
jgi:Protein of unknown function (DUF2917)